MRSLVIGALCVSLPACGEPAKPPPPPLPVDVVAVQATQLRDETEYLAELRPLTATALQPQVDGSITDILVRPGEQVTQGQVLMTIDPGPQSAAVVRARSTREAQQAQLRLAELNLRRQRALFAAGAVPRQAVDNAETDVASARNQVAALGADIQGSAAQLRYYQIRAPDPGVVGDIPVRVGQLVSPQTAVTSVTDNTVLEANIAIPIDRAHDIAHGTVARVVDDSGRQLAEGTVSFISPQANPGTQMVLVKANIDNRGGSLRGEQIARTRVVWRMVEGVTVPALAVVRIGGQPFVFVAQQAKGRWIAKQRPVVLGELTNNAYPVQKGLAPGDRVVVSQIQKLRDGVPIQPPHVRQARPQPPSTRQ